MDLIWRNFWISSKGFEGEHMRTWISLITFGALFLVGLTSQAIIQGDEVQGEASETIYLSIHPEDPFGETCTGVVLAPHLIVTAGHCIQGFWSNQVGISNRSVLANAGAIRQDKYAIQESLSVVSIVKKAYHPKYLKVDSSLNKPITNIQYDIGYLVTRENLLTVLSRVQAPLLPNNHAMALELVARNTSVGVGYGASSTAAPSLSNINLKKRKLNMSLDGDFPSDNYFVLKSNKQGQGICRGDSGSGIFVQEGSQKYLLGILSGISAAVGQPALKVPQDCGADRERAAYVDISNHLCWLEKETGIQLTQQPPVCN